MSYTVKEIFYSVQGEGANAGRPAVFCRFSGCNLWTGREADRASAICNFCDTDFVGVGPDGGRFSTAKDLTAAIAARWPRDEVHRFVVLTGGEPMLQVDEELVDELHRSNFEVALETNGTIGVPRTIDWICVSPKAGSEVVVDAGNELKLVYPQHGTSPEKYESLSFEHFFLQPMDSSRREENTKAAIDYCLQHPHWRLSIQTHKILGLR